MIQFDTRFDNRPLVHRDRHADDAIATAPGAISGYIIQRLIRSSSGGLTLPEFAPQQHVVGDLGRRPRTTSGRPSPPACIITPASTGAIAQPPERTRLVMPAAASRSSGLHHRHHVGLARGHVHLVERLAQQEEERPRPQKLSAATIVNSSRLDGHVRVHHRVHQADALGEPRRAQVRERREHAPGGEEHRDLVAAEAPNCSAKK